LIDDGKKVLKILQKTRLKANLSNVLENLWRKSDVFTDLRNFLHAKNFNCLTII